MAAARDYSIFDLYEFINDEQATFNFLQARNLISNNEVCPRCNQILLLSPFNSNINVGYVLRCPNRNCRARKSLIVDTYFDHLHFPLRKYIAVIYYWASQTALRTTVEHLKLGENTLIDNFNLIRDVCSWKLLQDPIILGGPDIIVQIDECICEG